MRLRLLLLSFSSICAASIEGGFYSRAESIQGRLLFEDSFYLRRFLFEGGFYSRAAAILGRLLFEYGFYSRKYAARLKPEIIIKKRKELCKRSTIT